MDPVLCKKIDQRLGKPIPFVVPCYELEAQVTRDKLPVFVDKGHCSPKKAVSVTLGGPRIVDKPKRAGKRLKTKNEYNIFVINNNNNIWLFTIFTYLKFLENSRSHFHVGLVGKLSNPRSA